MGCFAGAFADVAKAEAPDLVGDEFTCNPFGAVAHFTGEAGAAFPVVDLGAGDDFAAGGDGGDELGYGHPSVFGTVEDSFLVEVEGFGVAAGEVAAFNQSVGVVFVDAFLDDVALAVGAGAVVDEVFGGVYDVVGAGGG